MKKITLLIISVTIISCAQDKVIDVNSLSKQYDIPSAVMGKINKDGTGMIQLMRKASKNSQK
jgi:hypothetical protein